MKTLTGLALAALLVTGTAAYAQDYNRDQGTDWRLDRRDDRRDDRHQPWRDDRHGDRGEHRDWGDRGTFNREWRRGDRMPDSYARDRRYIIDDYRMHRLPPPRRGYHWVRYGDRFCMVRDYDGLIYRIIRDLVR
jgi:Ni/Co efflux regulator RcnB